MRAESKDGGPAFPNHANREVETLRGIGAEVVGTAGMSLLDWFAGQALMGMIASSPVVDRTDPKAVNKPRWAKRAYEFAQAMVAEGKRQ